MLPTDTTSNAVNRPARYVEAIGDRLLAVTLRKSHSDSPDLISGQLGPVRGLARGASSTSLLDRIAHIIGMSAKKEMVRATARRIITVVADNQPVWNWAVRQNPSNTVSAIGAPIQVESSVAVFICESLPVPAAIGLVQARPESVMRLAIGRVSALKRTILRSVKALRSIDLAGKSFVALATVVTNQCYCWASHCVNSSREFALWLGSPEVCKLPASRCYYSTFTARVA